MKIEIETQVYLISKVALSVVILSCNPNPSEDYWLDPGDLGGHF